MTSISNTFITHETALDRKDYFLLLFWVSIGETKPTSWEDERRCIKQQDTGHSCLPNDAICRPKTPNKTRPWNHRLQYDSY